MPTQDAKDARLAANPIITTLKSDHTLRMMRVGAESLIGDSGAAFQKQLHDPGFRETFVKTMLKNPDSLGRLIRDADITDPDLLNMRELFDNEIGRQIALNHPDVTDKMANPSTGKANDILRDALKDPDVQATVQKALRAHPTAANDLQAKINSPELQDLLDGRTPTVSSPMAVSAATGTAAATTGAAGGATASTPVAPVVVAPVQSTDIPPLDVGRDFITLFAERVEGHKSAIKSNANILRQDENLMKSVGKEVTENINDIEKDLNALKAGSDPALMNDFMKKYPNITKAAVPIMAAGDPQKMANTTLNGMKDGMLEGIKDMPDAAAKLVATEEINSFIGGLKGDSAFVDNLGTRLADVDQGGNIVTNLNSLAGKGSGDFQSMKIIMDDMKNDPNGVMNVLASDMFMAQSMMRWGGKLANAKIDTMFDNLEQSLANFADSEMGMMLKQNFGIDLGGMVGQLDGFKDTLKGIAGPMMAKMGGTMQNYQVAGKIGGIVNENMDKMGIEGTYAMNSQGNGLLAGVKGQFDAFKTRGNLAGDAYAMGGGNMDDYAQRQADFETRVRSTKSPQSAQYVSHQTGANVAHPNSMGGIPTDSPIIMPVDPQKDVTFTAI